MASSLVVEHPSISKISARPTPGKNRVARAVEAGHAVSGLSVLRRGGFYWPVTTTTIILWPSNSKRETI